MGGPGSGRPKGAKASAAAKVQAGRNARKGRRASRPSAAETMDVEAEVNRRLTALNLPPPSTWPEARTMEQTRAEIYRTMTACEELAAVKGSRVEVAKVVEAADAMRDTIHRHIERVPRLTAERVEAPPAMRQAIADACTAVIRECLTAAINEAQSK